MKLLLTVFASWLMWNFMSYQGAFPSDVGIASVTISWLIYVVGGLVLTLTLWGLEWFCRACEQQIDADKAGKND